MRIAYVLSSKKIVRSARSRASVLRHISVPQSSEHNCIRSSPTAVGNRGRFSMSVAGQSLPKWDVRATSAFPLIATEGRTSRDVSNVPTSDIRQAVSSVWVLSQADCRGPLFVWFGPFAWIEHIDCLARVVVL